MTERRPELFWPLGGRIFAVAGTVLLVTTLLRTAGQLGWPHQDWAHTNAAFEQAGVDITGPFAAAFGAYLSGRLTPPRRIFALPRFGRDPLQFLGRNLAPAALVATGAYLLGMAPATVVTATSATYGSLDAGNVVGGVLVINMMLLAGWLIGLIAQSAYAAPIAFALGYAMSVVSYSTSAWNAGAPVLADAGVVGFVETSTVQIFRICFFVAVCTTVLACASGILANRGFGRVPPARAASWWLLPAAFITVAVVRPMPDLVREANPPGVCRDASGLSFCVHRAHSWALDSLVAEVVPVVALVGRDNIDFDKVVDWSLIGTGQPSKDDRVIYPQISPRYDTWGVGSEIIDKVSGSQVCVARGFDSTEDSPLAFNAFMLNVRLNGDKEKRADNRFAVLSDKQLQQWLTTHRSKVESCNITDDLLP